jgi:streptogrisin B
MIKSRIAGLVVALLAALGMVGALAGPAVAAPPPYGGDLMQNDQYECGVGIPAVSPAGQWYIVTAGHCLANRTTGNWTIPGPIVIGPGVRWEFGVYGPDGNGTGTDAGAVRSSRTLRSQVRSTAATYQLTGYRNPTQGEQVCAVLTKSRRTACGTVTNANTSSIYSAGSAAGLPSQRIYNLAQVDGICAVGGDSGSPVLAGTVAVGVLAAAKGSPCSVLITRIGAVINKYGLRLA